MVNEPEKPYVVVGEHTSPSMREIVRTWTESGELDPDAVDQALQTARDDAAVARQLRTILTNVTER